MNKKYKLLVLSFLAIILVIILSISATIAFMKPVDNGENLTSVSLSSCAKIKLTAESSVNISNSYPMSRNRGLQTTPYSFTVTSYCDSYVGFNMYIAVLEDSTIDLKNVHYIITNKDSKTALQEGLLSELEEETTLSNNEKTELRTGIKGNFSKIYKMYSGKVPLKGNREYDLYLFIDENATNDVMGKTFKAGVAIKSYDREIGVDVDEVCAEGDNLNSCVTRLSDLFGSDETLIYHHDGTLENGIDDGSYRFAGASENVNNFVCFGSNEEACPNNNLYRIIGIIDGKVKLIKYDYPLKDQTGIDGSYYQYSEVLGTSLGLNAKEDIGVYFWNSSTHNNKWNESNVNKINLKKNFVNSLGEDYANKIFDATWKIGGNASEKIIGVVPQKTYQNEIKSPLTSGVYVAKIGLMYINDYGYAASPDSWTTLMNAYSVNNIKNWLYMGLYDWSITPDTDTKNKIYYISRSGIVSNNNGVVNENVFPFRPVFFLVEDSLYKLGDGTKDNPLRIN